MSDGNPTKAFINPARMKALNLHNLAGATSASAPPSTSGYGSQPPSNGGYGGYGSSQSASTPSGYGSSSNYGYNKSSAPPASGGYGAPPRPSYPPRPDAHAPRDAPRDTYDHRERDRDHIRDRERGGDRDRDRDRGGRDRPRGRGGRGGDRRDGGVRSRHDFGYDDSVRPRPKKTTTGWDRQATPAEQQYRMQHLAANAFPPNMVRNVPKSVVGLNIEGGNPLLPSGVGAPSTASTLGLLPPTVGGNAPPPIMAVTSIEPSLNDRQANRVYVGGITGNVAEYQLREFFYKTILSIPERPSTGPMYTPENMIKSVQMNGTYAFLEFVYHSDAEAAFSMDGITFQGLQLKVKAPKEMGNYYDLHPPRRYVIPGAIPSSVENGPNKLFLGNIPRDISDEEVRGLCETIGPLSAFNVVKNSNDGTSKGYAFLTYRDPYVTDSAIQFLNGHPLRDKSLSCSRAQDSRSMGMGGLALPAFGTLGMAGSEHAGAGMGASLFTAPAPISGPPARRAPNAAAAPIAEGGETRVLVLHNMASEQELREEYDEIIEDTQGECSNYGQVEEVMGRGDKIYVLFKDLAGAAEAAMRLTGRKFGPNVVGTSSMSEDEFFQNYSGRRQ